MCSFNKNLKSQSPLKPFPTDTCSCILDFGIVAQSLSHLAWLCAKSPMTCDWQEQNRRKVIMSCSVKVREGERGMGCPEGSLPLLTCLPPFQACQHRQGEVCVLIEHHRTTKVHEKLEMISLFLWPRLWGKLRQKNHRFEASMSYRTRPCLNPQYKKSSSPQMLSEKRPHWCLSELALQVWSAQCVLDLSVLTVMHLKQVGDLQTLSQHHWTVVQGGKLGSIAMVVEQQTQKENFSNCWGLPHHSPPDICCKMSQ